MNLPVIDERHQEMTSAYTSYGGSKLLANADVLHTIQAERRFTPICVQLAPTEVCDADCSFCSVGNRPYRSAMSWPMLEQCVHDFAGLGAKSIEITGGGNPLLYKHDGKTINDIVRLGHGLGLKVGIITNSVKLDRLDPVVHDMIDWIRISLAGLDEERSPEEYHLAGFPQERTGFSYIVSAGGPGLRTGRSHEPTNQQVMRGIARVVERFPRHKFMRIAGDCLKEGTQEAARDAWGDEVKKLDPEGKAFLKAGIDEARPFDDGCYVGMVRPYVASHPAGDGRYMVYACTSHVLFSGQTYSEDYALCEVSDVMPAWARMNERFAREGFPYEVRGNGGKRWCESCPRCFYRPNNELLHQVARPDPDGAFA